MPDTAAIPSVAYAIQLVVAPAFLLTGIGAILGVMANRLSRVVDRFRTLSHLEYRNDVDTKEMETLLRRSRWVHWAISLSTLSALLVCIVIAALFVGTEVARDLSRAVSLLFVSAMLVLIAGLLCFLREIALSTGTIEKPE
jgi:hypothetical protein